MITDLLLNFLSAAFHVMRQRTDAVKSVREMEHYSTFKRKFWHLLWHGLILKMSYSVKYASHKGTETVWSHLDEELQQTNSQKQKAKWGFQRSGSGGIGGYIGAVLKFCDTKTFWIWIVVRRLNNVYVLNATELYTKCLKWQIFFLPSRQ